MTQSTYRALWWLACFTVLGTACGSDDGDTAECEKAFDKWCACPMVTCMGRPESCTGPDLEWAQCINAATNACTATCAP